MKSPGTRVMSPKILVMSPEIISQVAQNNMSSRVIFLSLVRIPKKHIFTNRWRYQSIEIPLWCIYLRYQSFKSEMSRGFDHHWVFGRVRLHQGVGNEIVRVRNVHGYQTSEYQINSKTLHFVQGKNYASFCCQKQIMLYRVVT